MTTNGFGERGPQGDHGQQGETGRDGRLGLTGDQGRRGSTGDAGPRGPRGLLSTGYQKTVVIIAIVGFLALVLLTIRSQLRYDHLIDELCSPTVSLDIEQCGGTK